MQENDLTIREAATDLTFPEMRVLDVMKAFGVVTFDDLVTKQAGGGNPLTLHRQGYLDEDEVRRYMSAVRKAARGLGENSTRAATKLLSMTVEHGITQLTDEVMHQVEADKERIRAASPDVACGCGKDHGVSGFTIEADDRDDETWRRQTLAWVQAYGIARDLAEAMLATAVSNAELAVSDAPDPYTEGDEIMQVSTRRVLAVHYIRRRWEFEVIEAASMTFLEYKIRDGLAKIFGTEAAESTVARMRGEEADRG